MDLNRNMNPSQFAKAFYEEAAEKDSVSVVFNDLMDIRQIYQENTDIDFFFDNQLIEKSNKNSVLSDLIKNLSDLTQNFVQTIYNFQLMDDLTSIVNEFEKIYDHKNRTLVAKVITAIPLTDEQKERLAQALAKRLDVKKVLFNELINEDILGGVIIETENQVFDGSIRFNLEALRKQIVD